MKTEPFNWHKTGNSIVIIGGASGIGLAAAHQFVNDGLNVLIADWDKENLQSAIAALQINVSAAQKVVDFECDVSSMEDMQALSDKAFDAFGDIHCVMNNAGVSIPTGQPWENLDQWQKQVDINMWGVIHGCQAFIPKMLERGQPGAIINTGSKQGITKPPGNFAYNLSKAGVIAYTESVAYSLRQIDGCVLSAHLLVPGFTYTGMMTNYFKEKPDGAWTSEQVVDFMMQGLHAQDFYIICPDNEVTTEIDQKRIQWSADDIIKNRPAASRWHPNFQQEFEEFMK
jgi:NAD(P)-dependent dehydrogenase (short-subunit alcohol dehydrogenase family)